MYRAGLCLGVLAALAVFACGEDAKTPDCPPLPHYDVRVPSRREALRTELTEAAEKGCITLPRGFELAGGGGTGGHSGAGNGGVMQGDAGNGGATQGDAGNGGASAAGGTSDGAAGEGGSSL